MDGFTEAQQKLYYRLIDRKKSQGLAEVSKLIKIVDKHRPICTGYILYTIVFWYDSTL